MNMYEELKNKIIAKEPGIDDETLKYFVNYFVAVLTKNVIPEGMAIDELIDNVLRISKIVFFKDDNPITQKYGDDFKGERNSKERVLYIRDSLPAELKEITIYHEIHHAAQTNKKMLYDKKEEPCGINQNLNIGRLIMEAQTQWFAEQVYMLVHGVTFEEKEISSENLRMQAGQTIYSALHNYEMYDALLSKLAIMMGVSKEYFVKINYMYDDNKGLKKLEEDYKKAQIQKGLTFSFEQTMMTLDYAIVVDFLCYVKNEIKDLLLSGGKTEEKYAIYPGFSSILSQELQASSILRFDRQTILDLMNNEGYLDDDSDFIRFSKCIFDNRNRAIIANYIQQKKLEQNEDHVVGSGPGM